MDKSLGWMNCEVEAINLKIAELYSAKDSLYTYQPYAKYKFFGLKEMKRSSAELDQEAVDTYSRTCSKR